MNRHHRSNPIRTPLAVAAAIVGGAAFISIPLLLTILLSDPKPAPPAPPPAPVPAPVDPDADANGEIATKLPPDAKRFGWLGREAAREAIKQLGPQVKQAEFGAEQIEGSKGKRVYLWHFTRAVLGGADTPNYPQQIGDCVSFGAKNGVEYLQAVQIVVTGKGQWHPVFPPYIYGISRVQIGGDGGGGDGSVGAWAAEGVRQYGVLRADFEGVPKYSGSVASQWGRRPGPPAKFIPEGKLHLVKTVAQVKTYAAARAAIVNGYPVTVASNRGFDRTKFDENGRLWGVPVGSWAHQMCFVGVDDNPARPGLYCLNSWGENAFPVSRDGAPKGGFWVDAKVAEKDMLSDDAWAFSSFDGFPANKLIETMSQQLETSQRLRQVAPAPTANDVGVAATKPEYQLAP